MDPAMTAASDSSNKVPPALKTGAEASEETKREPRPQDRRTAVRKPLNAEIGMYSDSNFYAGFSQDISEGGMFVATYDLQPMGTMVDLEFMLPGGYQVKVKGAVRWIKDPIEANTFAGMGVQFVDLEPADLTAIQEFISNREPIFHD